MEATAGPGYAGRWTGVRLFSQREREIARRVQEEERRRLALDLHDDALQLVELLARDLANDTESPRARHYRAAVADVNAALRAVYANLHPPRLDDLGLPAALDWLVTQLPARRAIAADLTVSTADASPFGRLHPDLELALYRVAQEALNNCIKHAGASAVTIALQRTGLVVTLLVTDDGCGPSAPAGNERHARAARADAAGEARGRGAGGTLVGRAGIPGMRERLRRWRGVVEVGRQRLGGTLVRAKVVAPSLIPAQWEHRPCAAGAHGARGVPSVPVTRRRR